MKKYKETYIIGVDHGYGNMKTANCCFQTGVTVYDRAKQEDLPDRAADPCFS